MIPLPVLSALFSANPDRFERAAIASMPVVHLREPVLTLLIFGGIVMLGVWSLGCLWTALRSVFFGFSLRYAMRLLRRIVFFQLLSALLLILHGLLSAYYFPQ